MNLDDPFVKACVQTLLVIVTLALVIPGLFALAIAIDFKYVTEGAANLSLANAYASLPSPNSEQLKDLLGLLSIVISALPALFISVALSSAPVGTAQTVGADVSNKRTFSLLGKFLVTMFSVGMITGIVAFLLIDPVSWGSAHVLEMSGLQSVRGWARTTIQGSTFYIALLFGMKTGG